VTVFGLLGSFYGDLPPGPSVVGAFAVALGAAGVTYYLRQSEHRGRSIARLAAGIAAAALVIGGSTLLRKRHAPHGHEGDEFSRLVEALHSGDEARQIEAIHHLEHERDPHVVEEFRKLLQATRSDRLREHVAEALARIGDESAVPALVEAARGDLDGDLRVTVARALLDLRSAEGFRILVEVIDSDDPLVARQEAAKLLRERAAPPADADPARAADGDATARARLRAWWDARGRTLRWREATRRFE
jgi:hypothetical protein